MKSNYFLQNVNPQNIQSKLLSDINLIRNIDSALRRKNILTSNLVISEKKKLVNLNIDVFYRTRKLKEYRYKLKELKLINTKTINTNIQAVTHLFDLSNLNIQVRNLNLLIKKTRLLNIYKQYKFFSIKLFAKRINLFVDFVKILTLFTQNQVSTWLLCHILSLIFKSLHKKKHGFFLFFVNYTFKLLVNHKNSKIQGVKFLLSGRRSGKTRASYSKITMGKISLLSQSENIEQALLHCYTVYGCFGLKLWINYK